MFFHVFPVNLFEIVRLSNPFGAWSISTLWVMEKLGTPSLRMNGKTENPESPATIKSAARFTAVKMIMMSLFTSQSAEATFCFWKFWTEIRGQQTISAKLGLYVVELRHAIHLPERQFLVGTNRHQHLFFVVLKTHEISDQLTPGVEKIDMAGLWRAARIYGNTKNDTGKRQTVEGSQCTRCLSNSNYGTRTGQVRHYHNCSCRHLLWHKEQRYVIKTSNQNLIPGFLRKIQKIVKEGPSIYSRGSHKIRQEPPMRIPELW